MSGDFVECHADRPSPAVGADDRTDFTDDDLAVVVRAEHVDERVDVAAVSVHDGEVLAVPFEALHLVDEIGQRLGSCALLAFLLNDAVGDFDDRLDRQCGAEQRAGVADSAALLQVVEGVQRTKDASALSERGGKGFDVVD
jgi:hypothetical protein